MQNLKYLLPVVLLLAPGAGCKPREVTPQEKAFKAAHEQITSSSDGIAYGDTGEAKALALNFSTAMKSAEEEFFTGGKKNRVFSLTDDKFLTYCKINEKSILFLVHVPQLKRYKGEVRDSLNQLAWIVANAVTEDIKPDVPGLEIAVGLRGSLVYGGSAIGIRGQEPEYENSFAVDDEPFFKYFKNAEDNAVTPSPSG